MKDQKELVEDSVVGEVIEDEEPTIRIDGEPVITVANLQRLVNTLLMKLLNS